jgi:arginase family enzyme
MLKNEKRQAWVLNFDDSAGRPQQSAQLELQDWQEDIRFSCSKHTFQQFSNFLEQHLPAASALGCCLLGSGDYHHVTQALLSRLDSQEKIHLIVCDNHPDNMRYPLGIHCGSWVYWASRLEQVARIDVIGISSADISVKHAWENHIQPLRQGKLHYWSVKQSAAWTRWVGAEGAWHGYDATAQLMQEFIQQLDHDLPIYLSIDKDVFSQDVVQTNWDQGHFEEVQLMDLIAACDERLIGADITGDVSAYRYKSLLKRMLSAGDGQSEPSEADVRLWQVEQQQLNQRLIDAIDQQWRKE